MSTAFKFNPKRKSNDGFESDRNNEQRANSAFLAVMGYKTEVDGETAESLQDCDVSDLVSDLMHYCDSRGWDVEQMLRYATSNWEGER